MATAAHSRSALLGVRTRRSVGVTALLALLSLWTVGALHAAEHDARHESTPCDVCIAADSQGLVSDVPLTLGGRPDSCTLTARPHQDPEPTNRAPRHAARAPPTRRI